MPVRDRQRAVLVGELLETRRDEDLARHLVHGLEHARVAHAAAGYLALDHAVAVDRGMIELFHRLWH